ncbi:MAG: site-specific integrase [Spirochaetia bacterium]
MSLIEWSNGFWYYRLPGMKGYKSTGTRDHHEAVLFTQGKMKSAELLGSRRAPLLKEYSADFFVWDRCPHCRKLREEGRQITRRYAHGQRLLLDKYLLTDRIADKPLLAITRADILDYRSRLAALLGSKVNTANKTLAVLKTILKEALFREDLQRDPTAGVGNLKEDRGEAGIFTAAELRALFPVAGLGPWKNIQDKTVFLVAASTGMRRGEILALRWRHVDFEHALVNVDEAWKGREETGTPKWGHKRVVALPDFTAEVLRDLWERRDPKLAGSDCLVFCYIDGSRLGETWWAKAFAAAMKKVKLGEGEKAKVGIDVRARGIKPHSFRHTVATLRRDAGEDPAKIRAALGWTNERTQDGYTHFDAEMLRSKVVDEIWK